MKIAVVGATGLVGNVMLKSLLERKFPYTKIYPVASERSVGKKLRNTLSVIIEINQWN